MFLGLPTVQFLIPCSLQKRPSPSYHMNDVSVYPGRERRRGSLTKRMSLKSFLVVSVFFLFFFFFFVVLDVCKAENLLLVVQDKECMHKNISSTFSPIH